MNNTVQTFRAISGLIFKWLLIAIATLVAVIAIAYGVYQANHWFTYDRHVSKIKITVNADKELCKEDDYPIFVAFENNSTRTINEISFSLVGRVKGRSSGITNAYLSSDSIVKPGEEFRLCWSAAKLTKQISNPRSLEWSVYGVFYTFAE